MLQSYTFHLNPGSSRVSRSGTDSVSLCLFLLKTLLPKFSNIELERHSELEQIGEVKVSKARGLGSNPSLANDQLGDLGQVT